MSSKCQHEAEQTQIHNSKLVKNQKNTNYDNRWAKQGEKSNVKFNTGGGDTGEAKQEGANRQTKTGSDE